MPGFPLTSSSRVAAALCGVALAATLVHAEQTSADRLASATSQAIVHGGSVSFEVGTNIFSTTVRGESDALDGGATVHDAAGELHVDRIEASVPVMSLRTGLKKRDEHMREYIFRTPAGELPDVRFAAAAVECAPPAGRAVPCTATGTLAIRGVTQPFAMTLKVTRDGDRFRAIGDGKIALSAYGIERPSQFGVRTDDEVRIHLEVTAREAAAATSMTAARQ